MLSFATNNLEVAENSLLRMVESGDIGLNGDLENCESELKEIKEKTKSIQEKMSKLREINLVRQNFLDILKK